ncbi:MAG TPA: polysaccharide biosynthesis protein [Chitinophagaceae bacterium]|jgi:FlaA1/EpsC-like NDP-sugar epimerase|nr:polysaccharide biosynthesis protein [Chitinophagaceae bacterium]
MIFDLDKFIHEQVLERKDSFFREDIITHKAALQDCIEGKKVLVIGGGGTIGSNYIKSILAFKPASVVVVDSNENGLTELVRDVRSTSGLFVPSSFITYPVNFGSSIFKKIYEAYKPFDIITNFAAHKHVRSEKDIFSIEAMVQNNLLYAHDLLTLVEKDKPSRFFCVSTDKAANPVNIMGATKKLMEDLVMTFASRMHCTTARFANVAFSNGSLLAGFINRLMSRHPLSVPRDVTRYFVSPAESGDICMLTCMLGNSGEIFFPKFSESMLTSFYDITHKFLAEAGYTMRECSAEEEAKNFAAAMQPGTTQYPVYTFASDTTGEKLYEEFYTGEEQPDMQRFASLGVIKGHAPAVNLDEQNGFFPQMEGLLNKQAVKKEEIVALLEKYIPTFSHIETGKLLDKKM